RRLRGTMRGAVLHQRANQLGMDGAYCLLPPPRTFPAVFPWLRLDRIYQRGFAVRSARGLRGRPWSEFSDHAPLLAELALPGRTGAIRQCAAHARRPTGAAVA